MSRKIDDATMDNVEILAKLALTPKERKWRRWKKYWTMWKS